MTPARLDELEVAAKLVTSQPKPRGHRCGGTCPRCMPWRVAAAQLTHSVTLELIQLARELMASQHHCPGGEDCPCYERGRDEERDRLAELEMEADLGA